MPPFSRPTFRGKPRHEQPRTQPFASWASALRPAPLTIDAGERVRVTAGAALGLFMTAWVSHALAPWPVLPWLVAPLGASAVLVFAVPASPLAQPWAVLTGYTLSALVGILSQRLIPVPEVAAAVAVAPAIGVMMAARCLHPPGGAIALLMVLADLVAALARAGASGPETIPPQP